MKRITAYLILAALIVCFASCNSGKTGPADSGTGSVSQEASSGDETQSETEGSAVINKKRNNIKILFLGDSITYGTGLKDPENECYASLLGKKFGVKVYNLGIPGTLLARAGQSRIDGNSFIDRYKNLKNADIAVIFGGTNDYFWSDKPIYPPEGKTGGNEYFSVALKTMCKYLSENRQPGTTFFITPYPHKGTGNFEGGATYTTGGTHETSEKNFNGQSLSDYADCIEKVCGEYGITVINLHKIEGFDYTTMTVDGCHPTAEGHQWLAQIIGGYIEKILPAEN